MTINNRNNKRQESYNCTQRSNRTPDGIEVLTYKTDKALLFVWDDELREVVRRAKKVPRVGAAYLLSTQGGQKYTVDGFRQLWHRVM